MKAIIIDNQLDAKPIDQLRKFLSANGFIVSLLHYDGHVENKNEIIKAILSSGPGTIILLDVAFTAEEEDKIAKATDQELKSFTGFKLLQYIKHINPDKVMFLFTKNTSRILGIMAGECGVEGVVAKRDVQIAAKHICNIVRQRLLCSPDFYDAVKPSVMSNEDDHHQWIIKAFEGFFLRTTPAHRFGNLCENLKPFVIRLMPDTAKDVLDKLWRRLEDTHALLSLVDKGARDHVKHSGNVFWIGYHTLRTVGPLQDISDLTGFCPQAFADPDLMPYKDQLLFGWVMTSLFHDWAYANQKSEKVESLVKRIYPKGDVQFNSLTKKELPSSLDPLLTYVAGVEGGNSDIKQMLDWMINNWGDSVELDYDETSRSKVDDHGILSAAYLLGAVDNSVRKEYRNIFYQSTLAIALHNLADWRRKWSKREKQPKDVHIPFERYPLCGLLALSDNVQTWEREHENPISALDRPEIRELVRTYIRTGDITKFTIECPDDVNNQHIFNAVTRYSVTHGEQYEIACDELSKAIEKWRSQQHLKRIMEIFSLKKIFRVKLQYQIPMEQDIDIDSEG